MDTPAFREGRLVGIQPQPLPRTWLTCWECGHESPSIGGLHKHIRAVHKWDAWMYYWLHPEALQARIRANVRIIERDDGSPCWEYIGRRAWNKTKQNSQGYCQMRVAGAPTEMVHRLSMFAFNGVMPDAFVLHACDHPPCCNPAHLSEGSHAENMAERSERGRAAAGAEHYKAALDVEAVQEARWLLTLGWGPAAVGRKMEVNAQVIERLRKGASYRDVPYDPAFDANFIPW